MNDLAPRLKKVMRRELLPTPLGVAGVHILSSLGQCNMGLSLKHFHLMFLHSTLLMGSKQIGSALHTDLTITAFIDSKCHTQYISHKPHSCDH